MGYRTYTCPTARACGGCEWLAVPYPIQLRRKQEIVEQQLGGIVAEDDGTIASVVGMSDPVAYRHKCATPFAPGKGNTLRSGFYAAGTHRIAAADSCLVEHPLGRSVVNAVARHAAKLGIPAYHEDSGTGCLRHAVVRIGYATGEALLTIVTNGRAAPRTRRLAHALMREFPQLVGVVQNVNTTRGNAMLGRECHTLAGRATMRDALLGCTFEIGATSFYQTNPAQTEALYRIAIAAALGATDASGGVGGVATGNVGLASADAAGTNAANLASADAAGTNAANLASATAADTNAANLASATAAGTNDGNTHVRTVRLLDAYCGCGTIGACVAAAAARAGINVRVTGVERVGAAVSVARRNAAANGLADACAFVCDDATAYLGRIASGGDVVAAGNVAADFDVVVLDPPRAGSTPNFLAAVASIAPERVVYVSCNVATQARDLQLLRGAGYRVVAVTPVDLFPHTKHVETVALLARR